VTTTPAAAGNADIALAAPSGSTTVKRAFQFLQSEQVFAKAGFVGPFRPRARLL